MRAPLVVVIALLSPSLVAGTCEFRATSNNAVRPPTESGQPETPPSGLVVDVRIGDPIDGSAVASTSSLARAALASSVLSNANDGRGDGTPASESKAWNEWHAHAAPAEAPLEVVERAGSATISNPVPEPGATVLFGAGLLAAAWQIRRRGRASIRERESRHDDRASPRSD